MRSRHCTAFLRMGRFIVDSVYRASCTKNKLERLERGGPAVLTVKTEVNGDSKSTNECDPSLIGSRGLSCRYKRFLFCLGCSSRPRVQYIIFLTVLYFSSIVPIAQQAGQAAVLGRLSLSVRLWKKLIRLTDKYKKTHHFKLTDTQQATFFFFN
jgi:hypothetical protein